MIKLYLWQSLAKFPTTHKVAENGVSGNHIKYRMRAIITRGLYIFYPIFEGQNTI